MHKYVVEVHIEESHGEGSDAEEYVFRFPETSFIAVTSYLSPKVQKNILY